MRVTINGADREYPANTTVAALVAALNIEAAAVVAEVSGTVVPPEQFATTVLRDGDRVELIRFVGGG
jgi:thiamine biosynthesis protein ThiS